MKYRYGFVSNSSSSSFVIEKENLSQIQLISIRRHMYIGGLMGLELYASPWNIHEDKKTISGSTNMDNFNMAHYLQLIGVNDDDIKWSDY